MEESARDGCFMFIADDHPPTDFNLMIMPILRIVKTSMMR